MARSSSTQEPAAGFPWMRALTRSLTPRARNGENEQAAAVFPQKCLFSKKTSHPSWRRSDTNRANGQVSNLRFYLCETAFLSSFSHVFVRLWVRERDKTSHLCTAQLYGLIGARDNTITLEAGYIERLGLSDPRDVLLCVLSIRVQRLKASGTGSE